MKNTANWAAMAAFVLGLGGFYLYTARLSERLGGGPTEKLLIATRDLSAGQILSEEHVTSVSIPARYFDGRRILASESSKVLGAALVAELHAGEGLVWSDLRDAKAHQSFAQLIAPGHRAFRLPPKANPLGRLLHVGDFVDVLLERAGKSEVLLEQVVVLALGNTLDPEEGGNKKVTSQQQGGVTLSVTQEQAAELFGAGARGDLLLVLRNPDETQRPHLEGSAEMQIGSTPAAAVTKREIEHVR